MAVSKKKPACPILLTASIVGKKWTIPVIEEIYLSRNKSSFNKILKALKSITPRNLSICLQELADEKMVKKTVKKIGGVGYSNYSLTKKGLELQELITRLKKFGIRYYGSKLKFCLVTKCSDCGKLHKSIPM